MPELMFLPEHYLGYSFMHSFGKYFLRARSSLWLGPRYKLVNKIDKTSAMRELKHSLSIQYVPDTVLKL